jgi:hypothetical protein
MYLIRSIAVAQSGRRDELVGVFKEFIEDMRKDLNFASARVLTASIGPTDATVIMESEHATLAEFEQGLAKVNGSEKMAKYGPKFAELGVAGTHRFEVYRVHK